MLPPISPDPSPSVTCVVLNLNGKELLLETLESLQAMTYDNFDVMVVDNGSEDGSQDAVKSRFPGTLLIENGENLGFGGGNNVGMAQALAAGRDWIFVLNNDIAVAPDLLTEMIAQARCDERIGVLCPKIYYYDQPDLLWYAGSRISFATGMIWHRGLRREDKGQFDQPLDTDYATGCALLVHREVLTKIGLFDPAYFPAYVEDADLSMRARLAGYRIVYVPKAKVWHKVSAFSGGGMTPLKTRLKVVHTLVFFQRYARWYHWLTIPLCVALGGAAFVARELLKGNFALIGALLRGFGSALILLFRGQGSEAEE